MAHTMVHTRHKSTAAFVVILSALISLSSLNNYHSFAGTIDPPDILESIEDANVSDLSAEGDQETADEVVSADETPAENPNETSAENLEENPDETLETGIIENVMELEIPISPPEIVLVDISVHDMKFILDPFEFAQRGQILSSRETITNHSNVPVKVQLSSLYYTFANDTDFLSLDSPYVTTEYVSDNIPEKAIYLVLEIDSIYGNSQLLITDKEQVDVFELVLEASVYDENNQFVSINEGSTITVSLSGNLNEYPEKPWKRGDIRILMDFEIEPVIIESIEKEPIYEEVIDEIDVEEEVIGE